jgi:hypothetical protein
MDKGEDKMLLHCKKKKKTSKVTCYAQSLLSSHPGRKVARVTGFVAECRHRIVAPSDLSPRRSMRVLTK